MDVYCPRCGEPWDRAELHDVPGLSYAEAARRFRRDGCAVFSTLHGEINDMRSMAAQATYELLGDDMDGAASLLDDYVGWFE